MPIKSENKHRYPSNWIGNSRSDPEACRPRLRKMQGAERHANYARDWRERGHLHGC